MNKKIYLLTFLYFIFGISVNLIHPITPSYVDTLLLDDFAYGLLFSIMSFGQFFGAIVFGKLSDKFGRLYLLVIGLLGYALFQFCFGYFTQNLYLIYTWRFFSGFFVGAPQVLFLTFVSDLESDSNQRAKAFSILTAFYLFGQALGYKIGGLLYTNTTIDFIGVFLVQVGVLIVLSLLLLITMFKENKNHVAVNKRSFMKVADIKKVGFKNTLFFFLLMMVTIAQIMVTKYTEKYMIYVGYNANDLGTMMMVTGLLGLISNLLFVLVLKKKNISFIKFYAITLFISALCICITYIFADQAYIYMLYSTYAIFIMMKCIATPLEAVIINRMSNESNRGLFMGVRQSFLSLGNFLGPLLGGAIYGVHQLSTFYTSSLILVIIFILICFIYTNKTKENDNNNC